MWCAVQDVAVSVNGAACCCDKGFFLVTICKILKHKIIQGVALIGAVA